MLGRKGVALHVTMICWSPLLPELSPQPTINLQRERSYTCEAVFYRIMPLSSQLSKAPDNRSETSGEVCRRRRAGATLSCLDRLSVGPLAMRKFLHLRSFVAKTLPCSDSTCAVELGAPYWQQIGVKSSLLMVGGYPADY